MDGCTDILGDSNVYFELDTNWGCWQMAITEEDRNKMKFVTHPCAFIWVGMLFGLRNAPATFQRVLDLFVPGVHFITCFVCLNDILIFWRKLEDHIKHVDEVLTLLEVKCKTGVNLCSGRKRKCTSSCGREDVVAA